MKSRQRNQLLSALAAVLTLALLWIHLCDATLCSWLVAIVPVAVVGAVVSLRGLLVVVMSAFVVGKILVNRSDVKATKGHTIRRHKK